MKNSIALLFSFIISLNVFSQGCSIDSIIISSTTVDSINHTYQINGNIYYSNGPSAGLLTIIEQSSGIVSNYIAPWSNPSPFIFTNLITDGQLHSITAYFSDTTCTGYSVNYIAPCFVSAGPDANACGQTAQLASSGLNGYWSGPTGAIYTPSDTDPNASVWIPSYTGATYQATFSWNETGCTPADQVVITFFKPPHTEAGPSQAVCGTTTQLTADTIGSDIVSAYWTSNVPGIVITQIGSDPIPWNVNIDATAVPSFWVNSQHPVYFYWIAQNGSGCTSIDSTLVTFYEIPNANGGKDTLICGKIYPLEGNWSIDNSSGIWTALPTNPGIANFTPNNSPDGVVTVTLNGLYHFIWKEMNAGNTTCLDRDTVWINFSTVPTPDAGLDFSTCGRFAHICATPSVPGGQWSCPASGISYYDEPIDSITHNAPNNKDSACTWIRNSFENGYEYVTMFWFEFNGVCNGFDSVNIFFESIQPAVQLVDPTDSIVCGPTYTLLNAQQPAYGYGYWMDTIQNMSFYPSPTDPSPTATIDTGSVDYYGYHHFYWITVNGQCRDTSEVVRVKFIEKPIVNAGGNYWPGLFGINSHIKTDTVCGPSYLMNAIPSAGTGTWYSLNPSWYTYGSANGSQQSNNPTDSLFQNCACYPANNDFVWQENNENCVNSDTLRLYFVSIPSGQFTVTPPTCPQNNFTLIAQTWPLPGNDDYGVTSFSWNYPNGILDPSISLPAISDTILVSWTTGHHHDVTLVTTNIWGCSSLPNLQVLNEPYSGYVAGQLISIPTIDYSVYEINVYRAETNTEAAFVETIPVNSSGNFSSGVSGAGNFYLKAQLLNPNNIISFINTYYNQEWEWSNAQIVTLNCEDSVNLNFQLYGYTPASGGMGEISGNVRYDLTYTPVENADIYLQYKPTNEPAVLVKTNSLGEYAMTGIPMGNYRMTCEIPGLPQITTHHLVLNSANYIYTHVNFIVDTSSISKNYGFGIYADTTGYITVPVILSEGIEISVFPNPFTDQINISGTLSHPETVTVEIIDNSGKTTLIYPEKIVASGKFEMHIPTPEMAKGIYFVKVNIGNSTYVKKIGKT